LEDQVAGNLQKLGVITLFVDDVARSKAFYMEMFELELVFEDNTSAVMKMENLLLNLVVRSSAPELIEPAPVAAPGAGSELMFTIWVDDVDALAADLTSRGLKLLNGPIDRPWGVRTVAFTDPDGHAWELAQQIGH
jgi:catechol 2,3-dioxygenase-like lactoylglutathione lyase family enzyme